MVLNKYIHSNKLLIYYKIIKLVILQITNNNNNGIRFSNKQKYNIFKASREENNPTYLSSHHQNMIKKIFHLDDELF